MAKSSVPGSQNRPRRLDLLKDYKFESPLTQEHLTAVGVTFTPEHNSTLSRIILHTLHSGYYVKTLDYCQIVEQALSSQVAFFLSNNVEAPSHLKQLQKYFDSHCKPPKEVEKLLSLVTRIKPLVDEQYNDAMVGKTYTIDEGFVIKKVDTDRYEFVMDDMVIEHRFLFVMCVFSVALDSALTLLVSHACQDVAFSRSFYENYLEFFKACHRVRIRKPIKTVSLLKNLDGIGAAIVLEREEEWGNVDFLSALMSSAKEEGYEREISILYEILTNRVGTEYAFNAAEILESCSTGKLFGFPYTKIEEGADKVFKRLTERRNIDLATIREVKICVTENYCKAYFERHHKWPLMEMSRDMPDILKKAIMRNVWLDHTSLGGLPVMADEDWLTIRFEKHQTFDMKYNLIPYVKDRALGVLNSEAMKVYTGSKRVSWAKRKVIINFIFLKEPGSVLKDKFNSLWHAVNELEDDACWRLAAKEKEFKDPPRMFGIGSTYGRFMLQVLESNMKTHLDKYNPYQAMTTSASELNKKILAFSRMKGQDAHYHAVGLTLDAKAWCSYHSKPMCDLTVADLLDQIHGTNYWRKVYDFIHQASMYVKAPKGVFRLKGPSSAPEGMLQAFWTDVWKNILDAAFKKTGYKITPLVKGDDYRAIVYIPRVDAEKRGLRVIVREVVQEINLFVQDAGMKINVEESYASSIMTSFSKEYVIRSSYISSLLKKGAKIHPFSNALMPTVADEVSAIFSNAYGCCTRSPCHVPILMVCQFVTCWYLNAIEAVAVKYLLPLITVPQVLGGLPVFHLDHLMVQGESDHLGNAIAYFKFLAKFDDPIWGFVNKIMCQKFQSSPDMRSLCRDIYGLPLMRPLPPSSFLKSNVKRKLTRLAKDSELRHLFKSCSSDAEKDFCDILCSSKVIHGKIVSALYGSSVFSLVEELISSFESTQTIFQFLALGRGRARSRKLLEEAKTLAYNRLKWILDLIDGPPQTGRNWLTGSAVSVTSKFRIEAWGKDILGITYPHFTEMIPIIQPKSYPLSPSQRERLLSINVSSSACDNFIGNNDHYRTGGYRPFIGHKTDSSFKGKLSLADLKSPSLSKIKTLLEAYAFTRVEGSNIAEKVIKKMLYEFSGIRLEVFAPLIPERTSGSSTHRLRARGFQETIAPNLLSNLMTFAQGQSDTHLTLQGSAANKNINFLHLMVLQFCSVLFGSQYKQNFLRGLGDYWAITTDDPSIILDVEDKPMIVRRSYTPTLSFRENQLIALTQAEKESVVGAFDTLIEKHSIDAAQSRLNKGSAIPIGLRMMIAEDTVLTHVIKDYRKSQEAITLRKSRPTESLEDTTAFLTSSRTNFSRSDLKAISPQRWAVELLKRASDSVLMQIQYSPEQCLAMLHTAKFDDNFVVNLIKDLRLSNVLGSCLYEVYKLTLIPIRAGDLAYDRLVFRYLAQVGLSTRNLSQEETISLTDRENEQDINRIFMGTLTRMKWNLAVKLFGVLNYDENISVPQIFSVDDINYTLWFIPFIVGSHPQTAQALADRKPDMLGGRLELPIIDLDKLPDIAWAESGMFWYMWHMHCPNTSWSEVVKRWDSLEGSDPSGVKRLVFSVDMANIAWEVFKDEIRPLVLAKVSAFSFETSMEYLKESANKVWYSMADVKTGVRLAASSAILIASEGRAFEVIPRSSGSDQRSVSVPEYDRDKHRQLICKISKSYKLRTIGSSVTSASKLYEILEMCSLIPWVENHCNRVLSLADGMGGFASILVSISQVEDCQADVITLLSKEYETRAPLVLSEPIAYGVSEKVSSVKASAGVDDITSEGFLPMMAAIVTKYDICTMDAEMPRIEEKVEYYLLLLRNALRGICTVLSPGGLAIIKTFIEGSPEIHHILQSFINCFSSAYMIRPFSTHASSGEFYIVCSGYIDQRGSYIPDYTNISASFVASYENIIDLRLEDERDLDNAGDFNRSPIRENSMFPNPFITWASSRMLVPHAARANTNESLDAVIASLEQIYYHGSHTRMMRSAAGKKVFLNLEAFVKVGQVLNYSNIAEVMREMMEERYTLLLPDAVSEDLEEKELYVRKTISRSINLAVMYTACVISMRRTMLNFSYDEATAPHKPWQIEYNYQEQMNEAEGLVQEEELN